MKTVVAVGAQGGDDGKVKIVDWRAPRADLVADVVVTGEANRRRIERQLDAGDARHERQQHAAEQSSENPLTRRRQGGARYGLQGKQKSPETRHAALPQLQNRPQPEYGHPGTD